MNASDVIAVSTQLLPGFLTAWIFYSLTAHQKPTPFERVVQALIFTTIVQAMVVIARSAMLGLGKTLSIGRWNRDTELVWSVCLACVLGLVVSRLTIGGELHDFLRPYTGTRRTSFPSEWYSAFKRHHNWVILNLSGQRRLYGWPEEWPDHPGQGHFVIDEPEWLLSDGSRAPLPWVNRLLVPASEVQFIELMKDPGAVDDSADDATSARRLLIAAQGTKENRDDQTPPAAREGADR